MPNLFLTLRFQVFNVLFVMYPESVQATMTQLLSYPSLFQVRAQALILV